jgi:CDP-diacylglycerol--glycerol-3-phosphate 3-phosphatidyltransferase
VRSSHVLNAGTSLRILLTPAVMALVLAGADAEAAAAALFFVAAATDLVDGYLARRWNATSTLGSFLDTTADKLLVAGALFALVAVERASPWLAAIIVGRELVILGLRGAIAAGGPIMAPSMLGKLKASLQFLAVLLAILRPGDPLGGLFVDEWAMLVAAAITLASGVDYLVRFRASLTSPPPPPSPPVAAEREPVQAR